MASAAFKWVPVVAVERCTGCGLCVDACGPECLEIVDAIAALVTPDACGSEEHCIPVCEDDAIEMRWVALKGDTSIGKWR